MRNLLTSVDREPLQIGDAILEAQKIAEQDPEIAKDIKDLESAAKNEANSKLQAEIEQIRQEISKLSGQQTIIQNQSKLAENIGVVNQGNIESLTINQN